MTQEQKNEMVKLAIAEGENTLKNKENQLRHDVEWLINDIRNLKEDEQHDLRYVSSMLISHLTGSLVPTIIREYGEWQEAQNYMGMIRFINK